jgi:hypothetical protein
MPILLCGMRRCGSRSAWARRQRAGKGDHVQTPCISAPVSPMTSKAIRRSG